MRKKKILKLIEERNNNLAERITNVTKGFADDCTNTIENYKDMFEQFKNATLDVQGEIVARLNDIEDELFTTEKYEFDENNATAENIKALIEIKKDEIKFRKAYIEKHKLDFEKYTTEIQEIERIQNEIEKLLIVKSIVENNTAKFNKQ